MRMRQITLILEKLAKPRKLIFLYFCSLNTDVGKTELYRPIWVPFTEELWCARHLIHSTPFGFKCVLLITTLNFHLEVLIPAHWLGSKAMMKLQSIKLLFEWVPYPRDQGSLSKGVISRKTHSGQDHTEGYMYRLSAISMTQGSQRWGTKQISLHSPQSGQACPVPWPWTSASRTARQDFVLLKLLSMLHCQGWPGKQMHQSI